MGRDRLLRACAAGFGLLALGAMVTPASAQNPAQILDSLRRKFQVPLLLSTEVASTASRMSPGNSSGSQSGYGANFGDGFVGAGYSSSTRAGPSADGSVVAGFGLLNSRDLIGVEVDISSLSTINEGFGKRGSIGLKLHRVLPKNFAVAVGSENGVNWGGTDAPRTYYAVASRVFHLRQREGDPFGSMTINLGAGNGRFRTREDINGHNNNTIGPFGSVGLRVHESVSLLADWPGQDLTLGASIVPLRWVPLVITPAISDVFRRVCTPTGTDRACVGRAHFTLGLGLGFKFSKIRNIFIPSVR